MRRLRHTQPSLWEGLLAEEVAELWEPWMREVDAMLEDDELLSAVFEAQRQRHKESRRLGRHQTPAEVVLRMLLLKHVRNWSYKVLEREVRVDTTAVETNVHYPTDSSLLGDGARVLTRTMKRAP